MNECIVGSKGKSIPIERFDRTLRLYVQNYRVVKGNVDSDILKLFWIFMTINLQAHLKYTPIEILRTKDKQFEVEEYHIGLWNENKGQSLNLGQSVRILFEQTQFWKLKPVWSKEIINSKRY